MKPFQIGVLIFFVVLAMGAVFIFATFTGSNRDDVGTVSVWGTINEETVFEVLNAVNRNNNGYEGVSYQQIPSERFIETLVEAIAAGRGPDLVLLPSEAVVNEQDKLVPISYRTVSRRAFQDSFIEAGEIFLTDDGVLGLPFYIDPFVMYWNRTLFSRGGIARPPQFWDELSDIAPALSQSTENGTLTQSAVALGEWSNVDHAKDILVSLIAGLGNPIITPNDQGRLVATLTETGGAATPPAESALRFYTEFADPVKSVYSWNRSQKNSQQAFLSGTLAVYFGRASEVFRIREANPNLNFDIAPYPTVRGGFVAIPAELHALSIPRGARNPQGALQVAVVLAGAQTQTSLVEISGLPSVRRDVLSVSPENPYEAVFQSSALNAFAFRDPDPTATDAIFGSMIENISSGRLSISEALRSGQSELNALLGVVQ